MKDFYYMYGDLYIMFIPREKNKSIEDLFDEKVLNIKKNGKIFNKSNNINPNKEYSKNIFANIVRENRNNINFDKFKVEIFDRFKLTIEDHKRKLKERQMTI